MHWKCEWPEEPEFSVSLDMLLYSNSYLLALTASVFRENVNWEFFYWGGLFVPEYPSICLLHQNWNPAWSKLAKCSYFEVSRYSNLSFSKTTFLNFMLRSQMTVIYFQVLIIWNDQWFCPLAWNFAWLNMRKCLISFLFLSSFRLINIWSYQLEFFRGNFYRDVLWQYCVFLIIWFVVFQISFHMRQTDKIYFRATAPLI